MCPKVFNGEVGRHFSDAISRPRVLTIPERVGTNGGIVIMIMMVVLAELTKIINRWR